METNNCVIIVQKKEGPLKREPIMLTKKGGIILNLKNKKELLSHYLHQAYCCHRRLIVFEMRKQEDNAYYTFKIKAAQGEMNRYVSLAQDIANQLNFNWIDWSDPKKFVTYLLD